MPLQAIGLCDARMHTQLTSAVASRTNCYNIILPTCCRAAASKDTCQAPSATAKTASVPCLMHIISHARTHSCTPQLHFTPARQAHICAVLPKVSHQNASCMSHGHLLKHQLIHHQLQLHASCPAAFRCWRTLPVHPTMPHHNTSTMWHATW